MNLKDMSEHGAHPKELDSGFVQYKPKTPKKPPTARINKRCAFSLLPTGNPGIFCFQMYVERATVVMLILKNKI